MTEGSGPIYFDPGGEGLRVFVGSSEALLMEMASDKGELTVKKALYHWPRRPRPAYTTVMTILTRLVEKGWMSRVKDGRSFRYRIEVERQVFLRDRLDLVVGCLRKNFPQALS